MATPTFIKNKKTRFENLIFNKCKLFDRYEGNETAFR